MDQKSVQVLIAEDQLLLETAEFDIPSLPDTSSRLRHQAMDFLCDSPLSCEEMADLELAIGEACTNAVKHGSPRGGLDTVRVRCVKREQSLLVEVSDEGNGFDPDSLPSMPALADGGMGIPLMRMLVDLVEFEFGSGTTVRLTKHCGAVERGR